MSGEGREEEDAEAGAGGNTAQATQGVSPSSSDGTAGELTGNTESRAQPGTS